MHLQIPLGEVLIVSQAFNLGPSEGVGFSESSGGAWPALGIQACLNTSSADCAPRSNYSIVKESGLPVSSKGHVPLPC